MVSKNPVHPRPWHRGSVFGDGPRRPLDRERRARFRYLARSYARAGRLTAKGEWVLVELLEHLSRDGRCDPSHERLAAGAAVSVSTVVRALAAARDLGLLTWTCRIVRAGWRAEQTSNAYVLNPVVDPPPARSWPGENPVRTSVQILESGFTSTVTIAGAREALAAIAAGRGARFAAKLAEEKRVRRARESTLRENRH